jgi:hypothetical protein
MRDLQADWKRWSRGERMVAVTGSILLAAAIPLALLIAGA